ncbi:YgaP-like transmembrane domain [Rhodococcus jostii]|uniref:YgaP-like transmembrane domain n=1 Tax=Rhodococcus jostii TaxID=132919 RepID=UPI00365377B2
MAQGRSVNVTLAEPIARIVIGVVGTVGGLVVIAGGASLGSGVLAVLLIAAVLDLVVTGATGHCPLYQRLGHVPGSLKGGTS